MPASTTSRQAKHALRRAAREQRRAVALATRQQRSLYREQKRALRRTSALGPLLLVTVGIMFLLLETGSLPWQATTLWFGRWWPMVLIVAGFVLLGEWAVDSWRSGQANLPLPRRTLGVGGVFLLLLLTLAGASAMGLAYGTDLLRRAFGADVAESWGLDRLFAWRSETQLKLDAPFTPGALLRIEDSAGAITVTGASSDGRVHVVAHQRLWAWQNADLRRRQARARPVLEASGTGLLLRVNGEGNDVTDLTIEVPHEAAVEVAGEKGEVALRELRGPVTVQDHRGGIVLTAVTGRIQLTSGDQDATIAGHSLTGDLTLDGSSGDLDLSDVAGAVDLRGDFFGTTHLARVKGPVRFRSSFTDFSAAAIPGTLTVEGRSELEGDNLSGPVTLSTTERAITLSGVHGALAVSNRSGSVNLKLADPLGPVRIATTNSPIDAQVPPGSGFRLVAEVEHGDISTDLGLTPSHAEGRSTLIGQIGKGGPEINLRTTEGTISVRKGTGRAQGDPTQDGSDD